MNPDADAKEVCDLLSEQKELLWRIHYAATEPPGKISEKADLANFLFTNALHIHEMSRAALLLMEARQPYAMTLLGRSALESMFNLVAAVEDRSFGPQRIAHELEELARKLKFLLQKQAWSSTWRPTPEDCLNEAARIRKHYNAPAPTERRDRDRIDKVELIAKAAGLNPYYDDDYRQLSLSVHSNQAGIINSASGYLIRKGMLAICSSTFMASQVLTGAFRLTSFDSELATHQSRLETLINKPQFLPRAPGPSE